MAPSGNFLRDRRPAIIVLGDLDMASDLLALGSSLAEGRVAMVLPSETTPEQAEAIRAAIHSILGKEVADD